MHYSTKQANTAGMELYLGDSPILSRHAEVFVQNSGVYGPSSSGDHFVETELSHRRDTQTFVQVLVTELCPILRTNEAVKLLMTSLPEINASFPRFKFWCVCSLTNQSQKHIFNLQEGSPNKLKNSMLISLQNLGDSYILSNRTRQKSEILAHHCLSHKIGPGGEK
jgi:hypothetical protein